MIDSDAVSMKCVLTDFVYFKYVFYMGIHNCGLKYYYPKEITHDQACILNDQTKFRMLGHCDHPIFLALFRPLIYYHCTRDSALLLSFLLTGHPYIRFHFMK